MRNARIVLVALFLVSIMALAGCGVQEKDVGAPAETQGDIVFGFSGGLTGSLATLFEPMRDAMLMPIEEKNAAGGIHGRQIKFVAEDDTCTPGGASTAAQKLVNADKAIAILGPGCSGSMFAAAPIYEEAGVLVLSASATNDKIRDLGDYIFRNVPPDGGQSAAAAQIVKDLGAEKVGILYLNNDWGVGLVKVFKETAEELGLEIVGEESFEQESADMKTQLTKLKESGMDLLYYPGYSADTIIVLKQLRELGIDVQVVGADGAKDDAVIEGAGNAAEGMIVTLPGVPDSPEKLAFAAKFKEKFGKEPSAYTYESYDASNILLKACEATDCTSAQMKDYLYAMGDYVGASGTYAFDANGEVEKTYDLFQVKDGVWAPYQG